MESIEGLLPPAFDGTSTRIKHLSQAAEGFQVWSNTLYIATGVLGAGLASGMPIALGRRGQIATRVIVLLVSYMVVVTGLVSTWYHRIGTDDACPARHVQTCSASRRWLRNIYRYCRNMGYRAADDHRASPEAGSGAGCDADAECRYGCGRSGASDAFDQA